MNNMDIKEQIARHIQEKGTVVLGTRDIAIALRLRGKEIKRLQHWLNELVREGRIVRIRENRYSAGEVADLVTGKLALTRSGAGFVERPEAGSRDVFVPKGSTGTAMHGDLVTVRLDPNSGKAPGERATGSIIRIMERGQRDIVGTLKSTGKFFYVVPIDPVYQQDFYVPDAKGARIDDRVVIRFMSWENSHVSPEAEVLEVLGPADKPSVDTISVIRHFGFRVEFPEEVVREAETVSSLLRETGRRLDLRNRFIFTIDPEKARDFDDALSLERGPDGSRVLGVHIADVSHFVRRGGALDVEAVKRGNSVYLPDKVIPMLPEQLSNGICSLNPNQDRMTFSVFLTVDGEGRVLRRQFARSVIRSKLRLTYEQAYAVIRQGGASPAGAVPGAAAGPVVDAQAARVLRDLNTLAQQMRRSRFAKFALELDVPECEVQINPQGYMTGIRVVENDASHQLVEECMVAANEAVVAELSHAGVPVITRVHEPPKRQKILDLTQDLQSLGFRPGDLNSPRNMSAFLKSISGNPLAHHVRVAVLRSMNRAVYSAETLGHYGLAKKYYGHFTSPIRRYPDLVLHRQLAAALQAGKVPGVAQMREQAGTGAVRYYDKGEIAMVSMACSRTEQAADDAERAIMEIKKYRFLAEELKKKKRSVHEAVVVTVTNFGMFVELMDLQLQGLIHISDISNRFVKFNKQKRALEAGRDVYKLGRKVKVIVDGVDFDKRKLDFTLVG